ncbi:Nn.00g022410.m01.CDS01 [Neocucurbitaria sp. VM-36]
MCGTTFLFAAGSVFALSFAAPLRLKTIFLGDLVARDTYVMFGGDGSADAGWPTRSDWMPFEEAWDANLQYVQNSCKDHGWGQDNEETETQAIKDSIEGESETSGIPKELILAVMMQESMGCVRVHTSHHGSDNPGLLQSAGKASCNPDGKPISPCPANEIRTMIHEGTAGEGLKTTLKNSLDFFDPTGTANDSKWYKVARRYNAGEVLMDEKNLGIGPTNCYASDIANRLVHPFGDSTCNSDVIATLSSAQESISTSNSNGNKQKDAEDVKPAPQLPSTVTAQGDTTTDNSNTSNKSQGEDPSPQDPIIDGAASDCTAYYTPQQNDTCDSIPADFATLRQLNSQLNNDCTNLWAGYAYCIAV